MLPMMAFIDVFTTHARIFLQFAIWIAASLVTGWLAWAIWSYILIPVARRRNRLTQQHILEHTRFAVALTAFTAVINLAAAAGFSGHAYLLNHPVWRLFTHAIYILQVVTATFLAYTMLRGLMGWYDRHLTAGKAAHINAQMAGLLRKTAKVLCTFIAATIILGHFGIQITGLLATAGVASLAVAFAAQETIANMIAGFILIVDRPFREGHRVELASGKIGDVVEIGLRSTKILSLENTILNIPNAEIAKSTLINLNEPTPVYTIRATIGVAYRSDLRRVKQILLDVMNAHPEVLKTRPHHPQVYFSKFGDWALELTYIYWIPDYREHQRFRDEINMAINDRFEAENIQVPFPQPDIHIHPEKAISL
jgi:MscS family membrane protein